MSNTIGGGTAVIPESRTDPFDPSVASPRYCASPKLEQRRELVQHLVEYSNQIIMIIGEAGIGKTAFAREIIAHAPDAWRIAQLAAQPDLNPLTLLTGVMHALDVDTPEGADVGATMTRLLQGVSALENADVIPLLIIDDAHELLVDTLSVLLQLAQGDGDSGRLHIVMLCRSDVTQLFGTSELQRYQGDIVHHLDIPPLDAERMVVVLAERMAAAGVATQFDDAALAEIHAASGGVPARMLTLAGERRSRPGKQGTRLSFTLRPPVIVGIVAVLVVAFAGAWLATRGGSTAPGELVEIQLPRVEDVVSAPPVPAAVPPEDSASRVAPASPQGTAAEPPVITSQPAKPVSVKTQPMKALEPVAKLVEKPGKPVLAKTPPEPPKVASAQPPAAPAAKPIFGVRDDNWFQQRKPGEYVLQLFGAHDRAAVLTYLQDSTDRSQLSWFVTTFKGRPWYVVCYGLYPDRSSARSQAQRLAPEYRRYSPWARSIGDIQAQLIASVTD